jgi:hypothetical protein
MDNLLQHCNNLTHPVWEDAHSIQRQLETEVKPPKTGGVETDGQVVSITDLPVRDFHLICQKFDNEKNYEKQFSVFVKKTAETSADFNIYAIGGLRIATFSKIDWRYLDGCATEKTVEYLDNDWVSISVKYREANNNLYIGCSEGLESIYIGHGKKQYYLFLPELTFDSLSLNSTEGEPKLEKLLLKDNSLDREIFNEYLEMVKNLPFNKINDDDFLSATYHLDGESFLEAVWLAYYKKPISDSEKYSLIGYIHQKASRRGLIKLAIRHSLEANQISTIEKIMIFIWESLKKIISIILMPFQILFGKSRK